MCRNPCLFRFQPHLMHWKNINSWVPLVHERALRFFDFDFEGKKRMSRNYRSVQLPADEELQIYRRYPNLDEYLRVYTGLIKQELEDELLKGHGKQNNVILHRNRHKIFFFGDEIGHKCKPNDPINLEAPYSNWTNQGVILKKLKNGKFHISLGISSGEIPKEVDIVVNINSNPNKRTIDGLIQLSFREFRPGSPPFHPNRGYHHYERPYSKGKL